MNELIFALQILVLVGALFWAARIGKEALIALCVLLFVLANFFILKQMNLFGWNVTCSDAFAIAGIFGLNMLAQSYGRAVAKKTIWISFFGLLFFAAISQIHLMYLPSPHDESHAHFSFLLSLAPRMLIASLLTFLVVQQFDLSLYRFFQKRLSGFSWQARNMVCLFISQILDTFLFSILGLYGIIEGLTMMMVMSYLVKCAVIALTSIAAIFFNPLKKLTEPDEV